MAFIDATQANDLSNVILEENDVLYNITGASVCRCTILPKHLLPARVNQHVSILRCNKEYIHHDFLLHTLLNKNMKTKMYSLATSNGATREAITKKQLQDLELIVPPLKLQHRFSDMIASQRQAEANLKDINFNSNNLFQSLLQKAFKGELVS